MATSLTGKTPGAPDNTYEDLLHTHLGTRATGAQVLWGDGGASALVIWENGVGVMSGDDQTSKFLSLATAARTLTLPDATGTVVLGDGTGITDAAAFRAGSGMLSKKLGVDFANATNVAAAVAGFTVGSLVASKTYHFKMVLIAQSAAAASGMNMKITGPAEVTSVNYHFRNQAGTFRVGSAFGSDIINDGFVGADVDELILIEGIFLTSGAAPASPLGLEIWSETDTVAVTLKAGSLMILTEY